MIINEDKLKLLLANHNMNKSDLCNKVGISSRTIAKISKGEKIGNVVLNKVLQFFNCNKEDLVQVNDIYFALYKERKAKVKGGIYHETQVRLTYNSNHIEGSRLTEDQTRYIFETKTLGDLPSYIPIDDVIETNNHFLCIDYLITYALSDLTEEIILNLHQILKTGTSDASNFGAGRYKIVPNTVGGIETCKPENVSKEIKNLLSWYNSIQKPTFEDIIEFHYRFETVHPFQDGNGRVGRLIMFKECLRNDIVPFYIDDNFKAQYYNGLKQWKEEKGYLLETCRFGQDMYKKLLDYFEIKY